MGRPVRVTDEDILATARACFAEEGPQATLASIAWRLDISPAALHQRVGGRQALLKQVFAVEAGALEDRLRAPPADDAEADLVLLLKDALEYHRALVPGLVAQRTTERIALPRDGEAPPLALRRRLAAWLGKAGWSKEHAGTWAELLLGAIEARCFNVFLGGPRFARGTDEHFLRDLAQAMPPREGKKARR